jgi:hypothetical protein
MVAANMRDRRSDLLLGVVSLEMWCSSGLDRPGAESPFFRAGESCFITVAADDGCDVPVGRDRRLTREGDHDDSAFLECGAAGGEEHALVAL